MKRSTRMMLLQQAAKERSQNNRNERTPQNNNDTYYVVTDRFRDRTGREHYDNGRFAPMRNYGESEYEMNDRRMETERRSALENEMEMRRYTPTWDGAETRQARAEYPSERSPRPVRGFMPESHYDTPARGDEMKNRYSAYERGHASSSARGGKLDHETLERWMRGLKNEDGTTGAHWTVEQTSTLAAPHGVDLGGEITPELWNAAVNMMYSDYCGVGSKLKVNTPEFYAGLAKAFLMDKDGGGAVEKLSAYYHNIVA